MADAIPLCIPPDQIALVWPHVCKMIEKAYDKTDYGTFDDVVEGLFRGRALLWVVWREPDVLACVVTQVRPTMHSKVCYICACGGGQRRQWTHMMARIEEYARGMGCDKIRAIGRKGWTRVLPDFREKLVVFEKDISE